MGYYTHYQLEIENKSSLSDYSIRELLDNYKRVNELDYCFEETCKWYDYNEDMIKMSIEINDVLFIVMGHGEEVGDHWKHYFYNGNDYLCKGRVVYEEPDLALLGVSP